MEEKNESRKKVQERGNRSIFVYESESKVHSVSTYCCAEAESKIIQSLRI